jgi:tRNA (cytidine/uridine-2'-O-)-methyltransferase
MFNVVLYQPEIPQNTGNIARTCAAVGAKLHLIRPLGFAWDTAKLRRAGMDYWDDLDYTLHDSWESFKPAAGVWAFSSKVSTSYYDVRYQPGDYLLFGPESRGLPAGLLEEFSGVTIPMPGPKGRSLNLAVAVGVGVYEALRQNS